MNRPFRLAYNKAVKHRDIPNYGTWQQWYRLLGELDDTTLLKLGIIPIMWRQGSAIERLISLSAAMLMTFTGEVIPQAHLWSPSLSKRVVGVFTNSVTVEGWLIDTLSQEEIPSHVRAASKALPIILDSLCTVVNRDPMVQEVLKAKNWSNLTRDQRFLALIPLASQVLTITKSLSFHLLTSPTENVGTHDFIAVQGDPMMVGLLPKEVSGEPPKDRTEEEPVSPDSIELTPFTLKEWQALRPSENLGRLIRTILGGALDGLVVGIAFDSLPQSFWRSVPPEETFLTDESRSLREREGVANLFRYNTLQVQRTRPELSPDELEQVVWPFSWKGVKTSYKTLFNKLLETIDEPIDWGVHLRVFQEFKRQAPERWPTVGLLILTALEEFGQKCVNLQSGDLDGLCDAKGFNFNQPARDVVKAIRKIAELCKTPSVFREAFQLFRAIHEEGPEIDSKFQSYLDTKFCIDLYISVCHSLGTGMWIHGVTDDEFLARATCYVTDSLSHRAEQVFSNMEYYLRLPEFGTSLAPIFDDEDFDGFNTNPTPVSCDRLLDLVDQTSDLVDELDFDFDFSAGGDPWHNDVYRDHHNTIGFCFIINADNDCMYVEIKQKDSRTLWEIRFEEWGMTTSNLLDPSQRLERELRILLQTVLYDHPQNKARPEDAVVGIS